MEGEGRESGWMGGKGSCSFSSSSFSSSSFTRGFPLSRTRLTTQVYRSQYGLEDWTFAADGLMRKRQMSGNDMKIADAERWYKDGVDVNTVHIDEKHW